MRSPLSRAVRWQVDEMLAERRGDGSLSEVEWVAAMSRLHPEGFLEGYQDALTPPRGRRPEGRQAVLV